MKPVRVGDWSGRELRKHKRAHLGVPIECRSDQMTLQGKAENIGTGGLLVRAEKTFTWDEEIRVSFQWPGSTEAFEVQARVAHVVPDTFMGLEFLDLPSEASERIEQYIAAAPAVPERQG